LARRVFFDSIGQPLVQCLVQAEDCTGSSSTLYQFVPKVSELTVEEQKMIERAARLYTLFLETDEKISVSDAMRKAHFSDDKKASEVQSQQVTFTLQLEV